MLINAFKLVVLERYAQFEGRAGRAEYWWFVLANILISIVLERSVGQAAERRSCSCPSSWASRLIVPGLAVAIRRMHDTSRSGWWLLIVLVPFVGWIIVHRAAGRAADPGRQRVRSHRSRPLTRPGVGPSRR